MLDTLIFHTYILMNLFNTFNCRVVEADEKNIFKNIFTNDWKVANPLLWLVVGLELAVQLAMLWFGSFNNLGSILLGTTGLTAGM